MAKKNGKTSKVDGAVAAVRPAPVIKAGPGKALGSSGSLSNLIDPLLLAGGHTIKEIAAKVAKLAGEAATGKDLAANVRARMVGYRRKGWRVEKDAERRVKVVAKK